jgi:hypothetical protein
MLRNATRYVTYAYCGETDISACTAGVSSGKSAKRVPSVKDYRASIEKLRKDAAEAAVVRDLAIDKTKREMFDRLHQHFTRLADEIEQAIKSDNPG